MKHASLGRGGMVIPLVGLSLFAACGGTTVGTPGDGAAPPVVEPGFPQALASAWCANLEACCATWSYTYDRQACETAMRDFIQQDYVDRAAPLSGVAYDAAKAGECVQLAGAIAAACTLTNQQMDALGSACAGAYVGIKVAGESCSDDLECAPGSDGQARCDGSSDGGPTCVDQAPSPPVHGTAGDACGETCAAVPGGGTSCWGTSSASGAASCYLDEGLTCSSGGICTPLGQLGQPCDMGGCVLDATCESGECVERKSGGEACTDSGSCKDGLYCDLGTSVCAATKSDGEACTGSDECKSYDCENGTCWPENLAASDWACSGVSSSNP